MTRPPSARRLRDLRRRRRRLAASAVGTGLLTVAFADRALAHGEAGHASSAPAPLWVYGWLLVGAVCVAYVAVVRRAAAAGGGEAAVAAPDGREAPSARRRAARAALGALAVALTVLIVLSGMLTDQGARLTFAPTLLYLGLWFLLGPAALLLGRELRAANPWRTVAQWARAAAARVGRVAPSAMPYPPRLGRWPAVVALALFSWLQLAYHDSTVPRNVAVAVVVYSLVTFVAMSLYGIEQWVRNGEALGALGDALAETRRLGRRGAARGGLDTTVLLAACVANGAFAGLSQGSSWESVQSRSADALRDAGLAQAAAVDVTRAVALLVLAVLAWGIAAATVGRGACRHATAQALLAPIAIAYVTTTYLTYVVSEGQSLLYTASDPLDRGWNLFGTAGYEIDFSPLTHATIWHVQVLVLALGHCAAIAAALRTASPRSGAPRLLAGVLTFAVLGGLCASQTTV